MSARDKPIALGNDEAATALRALLAEHLRACGYQVDLYGPDSVEQQVDYPDVARDVGMAIRSAKAQRGVLVCGSGVGASVAACKIPGIRAAICHDSYSAHQGVEHDDMNVLCLGAEIVGGELAAELVRAFLDARFDGGERFLRRLEKVEALEKLVDG